MAAAADADQARLHQLGYKQELKRGLSVVSNFSFSFSIISVLTGVTSTYNTGLRYGGPASMTLGWLVVASFNACVALSMAEICSAYPTSGDSTTGAPSSPARNGRPLPPGSPAGSTSWDRFGQLGAFWNAAGVFVLVILIPSVAKERASSDFIFTNFNKDNGTGIHGNAYILAVGLLMSQYSMIGYDTSAHMNEETKNADKNGPIGIISNIFGWIYLVALTSTVTDIPYLLSTKNDAGGYAIGQALYSTFQRRYGSGAGGLACLGVIDVAMFLCSVACITSNSRMGYAFSRDGAMPYSRFWHQVTKHEVPLNVVLALSGRCIHHGPHVAGEPGGIHDDGVNRHIGAIHFLRIAHLLPYDHNTEVVCARTVPPRKVWGFCRLGVTVLFSLPVAYPVAKDTFNYTPVAVGGVLLLSVAAWVFHARFWFKGPIMNVDTY